MKLAKFASHVHSEWSDDASWTLPDLRRAFSKRGYSGVLLCEHDRGFTPARWAEFQEECQRFSDSEFLLVPGLEYGDADNVVHLPAWGDLPFFGEGIESFRLLELVTDAGGVAVMAHPWRRDAWERIEPAWARHLVAVEVWNRKYDGLSCDPRAVELADDLRLRSFVSLDFHTSRQFFPLATKFELEDFTTSHVLEAMREGRWASEFLGRSALSFTAGAGLRVMSGAEAARRTARDFLRASSRR